MTEQEALQALLRDAGVESAVGARLAAYGHVLLETNRHFNLSGAETAEELVPHILDSLSLLPYVQGPLVDVGSGGGMPAIPLAIATGIAVTLVESTTKKAAFLEGVLAEFSLEGRVIPQRAELAGRDPDLREQFACATARAVASAPTVLEFTMPFLRVGGVAVLQRGKLDDRERNALADAAPIMGGEFRDEITLGADKRILLVQKVSATPQRFPRRIGIPEKRPLCL